MSRTIAHVLAIAALMLPSLVRAEPTKPARFIEAYEKLGDDVLNQLRADPRRQVTAPSSADAKAAQAAFSLIRKDWAAASPHNRELLAQAQVELQKLRTDK